MAPVTQGEDQTFLTCTARSAEVCGLREFYVRLQPPVGNLGHFPRRVAAPLTPTRAFRLAPFFSSRALSPSRTMTPPWSKCWGSMASPSQLSPAPLLEGLWPLHVAQGPTLRAIDPKKPGFQALIDQGQWSHDADVRDAQDQLSLLPFIVPKAHCQQARNKDPRAWRTANDHHQSSPLRSQATSLIPTSLLCGTERALGTAALHHVLRVGQLQPLTAWRSSAGCLGIPVLLPCNAQNRELCFFLPHAP